LIFLKRQHQHRLDEKKINDFENNALKVEHVEKKFKILIILRRHQQC
jgi:hypothetical protein